MDLLEGIHASLLKLCHVPVEKFIFFFAEKHLQTGMVRPAVLKMEAAGTFPSLAELLVCGMYVGVALCIIRIFLNEVVLKPFGRFAMKQKCIRYEPIKSLDDAFTAHKIIPAEKMPELCAATSMSESKVKAYIKRRRVERLQNLRLFKFTESWWRFLLYTFTTILGIYANHDKPWIHDVAEYWTDYPLQTVSDEVKIYYMIEFGLYLNFFIFQFLDTKRKDFWEMFIHHVVTLCLIGFSYMTNFTRLGSIILLLHDVSDIFLEAAKILNYTKQARPFFGVFADITFVMFALVFFVSRLVLFPKRILYSTLSATLSNFEWHYTYYIWNGLLLCLQALHIFWIASGNENVSQQSNSSLRSSSTSQDLCAIVIMPFKIQGDFFV